MYGAKADDHQSSQRFRRFQIQREVSAVQCTPRSSGEIISSNLATAQQDYSTLNAVEALINLASTPMECESSTKEQQTQTDATSHSEPRQHSTQDASIQVDDDDAKLCEHLSKHKIGVSIIEGNDKLTQTFTGLPSWAMFLHLFLCLSPFTYSPLSILTTDNEMFLVLLRLQLNLIYEDLAQRFAISTSTAQRIFDRWIDIMHYRLKVLIKWPREVLRNNFPSMFQELYPKCVCIIDCSKIFIETPHSFSAHSATYSNYKKHNTVKFLIGITPNGCVCFLSKCWGGRVSDKQLTQESGFLNMLTPGDAVLADRGFTVKEDVAVYGAKLEIPSFTRGKKQLSQREVEQSQQLA